MNAQSELILHMSEGTLSYVAAHKCGNNILFWPYGNGFIFVDKNAYVLKVTNSFAYITCALV